MDKIDQKLLRELDINPRIPISKLAKKLRTSQQMLDYRMKRMMHSKTESGTPARVHAGLPGQCTITKLATIINLKALGFENYRIFFTFHSKKEFTAHKIFSYLKHKKGVYWAARIGGKYDLLIVLFVKDFEEFDKFIEDFNSNFPGLIKDYKSCYVTEHKIYRHKFLCNEYDCISYGYNDKPVDLDGLDHHILHKLKDDCRTPSIEIASQTTARKRYTYKTILNRIKAMEKNKVILGYRLFIKSSEHKPFIVLLSFKNYSRKEEKRLISYLGSIKEATQLTRLFGIWNLFIHVRIEDSEKLQQLLISLRDEFDIINEFEIIPVFEDISINLFPM